MTDLGKKMTAYRAKHRLSQKELADMCGVTLQTISNIEREVQSPSRVTEAKIQLVIGEEQE
jgi:transcriptional regulator with XRE-family HTH domain